MNADIPASAPVNDNETPIGVTVLGATGTIGMNTLDVLARHAQRFRVVALSAHHNEARLYDQCVTHRPLYAVLGDAKRAQSLQARLRSQGLPTTVLYGSDALSEIAASAECDYVMAAIVGAAGLLPTLAAARAGKRILLANKEALVMAGNLLLDEAHAHGALLLPIDSEHNAVLQCLPHDRARGLVASGVERILLTASGGPFYSLTSTQLLTVTPEQACAHPNWRMGRKISVDSATMMNKGLEVIEACRLFGLETERVDVVVHPQSIVHSLVEYVDGSLLAQLSAPDMRTPIAYALAWPQRIDAGVARLDVAALGRLDFSAPDNKRFPCLQLAYDACRAGGTAPAVLNAANEAAVHAFLDGALPFTSIASTVATVVDELPAGPATCLEAVLDADRQARASAARHIRSQPLSVAL